MADVIRCWETSDPAYNTYHDDEWGRPILEERDPALATTITKRFAEIDRLLAQQESGHGYRLYTELGNAEIKHLANAVNALSEPLSHLTAAVLP